jgi:DNA repair protein RadC
MDPRPSIPEQSPRPAAGRSPARRPPAPRSVRELPSEMRPREEMQRRGPAGVADEVLLAVLLRSGTRGRNVIELAREILLRTSGLRGLAAAGAEEIRALGIPGLGPVKAMELAAALELGRRAAGQGPSADPPRINDPAAVWRLLEPQARLLRQEVFWVLLLNAKHRLIGQPHRVTMGLVDASPVHPREVFSPVLRHNAAAAIIAHNHPSGDPTPSPEDIRVTRQLVESARIMELRLLDHVIIGRAGEGRTGYLSLREQGLVDFG